MESTEKKNGTGARKNAPPSDVKKPANRARRNVALALMVAGYLLISYALFAKFYSGYMQKQLVRQYKSSFTASAQADAEQPSEASDATDSVEAEAVDAAGPVLVNGIWVVGVLTIPKIDLTVAIGEGTDSRTLRYAAGHFADTAQPGEIGNCCILGHRNYTFGQFFNRLNEVAVGDEIFVESGGQTYTYVVTETFVVDPDEVWVLDPTDNATVTLVTCTPIRVATQRLIVRGVLEE